MNENIEDSLASGKRFPLIKSRPLILGIVLGVLFLIVAFKGSTLALVGASLAKVDLIPYVVGVGMYGVYLVIRAYRWKLLLADISPILPFFPLLKATFWGTAANVVIPHSGEVLRSFMIGKSLSVPATKI
ncbi:MAG: lysylphosphatidylglycerol synthase domain-containing protein, partial [Pseudomonadota bacterium]